MNDEVELSRVLSELTEIRNDVRRQGRAAIAAQAAAEQCLEEVRATRPAEPSGDDWLRGLMPVFDALDRSAIELSRPRPTRWSLWGGRRSDQDEGLRLLQAQLTAALADLGISVHRPLGERFDPGAHRAVGRRPGKPGVVVEVVRAGYRRGEALIREADVIVGGAT